MKSKLFLFIIVNFFVQTFTLSGWNWHEVDPYFSTTTVKPISSTTSTPKPTTTSTPQPPPTTVSVPSTTTSQSYNRCIRQCPSLSSYDPICGTDNMTYDNLGKLFCAKKCGKMVAKLRDGVCPSPSSTTKSPPTPTFGTLDSVCFKRCLKTTEYSPVCGTNNESYNNLSRLKCAKMCGLNIDKSYDGPCSQGTQPSTNSTAIRPTTTSTNLPPDFRSCVSRCVVSYDYKPVCGSDGSTYDHETELTCDASCGKNVRKLRDGAC